MTVLAIDALLARPGLDPGWPVPPSAALFFSLVAAACDLWPASASAP